MINQLENLTSLEKAQIEQATVLMKECLQENLIALYLYGSAVESGLKVHSDIDLLLVINKPLSIDERGHLMRELLKVSAYPLSFARYRALEVTIVITSDIDPWRFPAKRELQFGEWLREEISHGIYEGAVFDPDLTILLTQVRNRSIALIGDSADKIIPVIPQADLLKTLQETLKMWQTAEDLIGDERNIILTLARILYSQETGEIVSKNQAALWLLPQLPAAEAVILHLAHQEYLGLKSVDWEDKLAEVKAFVVLIRARFTLIEYDASFSNGVRCS